MLLQSFLDVKDCEYLHEFIVMNIIFILNKYPIAHFSMVNIQKKIYNATESLQFFVHHKWHFKSVNFNSIRSKMSASDNIVFNTDTDTIDNGKMLDNVAIGTRQFCLKEPLESLPQARVHFKRSEAF